MDDLISRQAAIDAVIEITYDQTALYHGWVDPYYVVNRLEYLPTAEPNDEAAYEAGYTQAQTELKDAYKPRKGKWIRPIGAQRSSYRYQCTECGEIAYQVNGNCGRKVKMENAPCSYRFCPNCGARMEESDEATT